MGNIEAKTVVIDENHYLQINTNPTIKIPISSDNANEVKNAFCAIIAQLRKGMFKIDLIETEKDLFYFVASEYVDQLNSEMQDIYDEMAQEGFITVDGDES